VTTATRSVQAELAVVFARNLHIEVPTPETDLLATGRLDSIVMVELLLHLDKRFGLRVDFDEDLDNDHFRTLAAIAALIAARRNGAS
jgi:acyl carrier protein